MESFLPTEIARLVYGYLIEENCESAANCFLESSIHLRECLIVTKKGRRFNTRVSGLNLVQILDKLCEVTYLVKTQIDKGLVPINIEESTFFQQLKILLIPTELQNIKIKPQSLRKHEVLAEEDKVEEVVCDVTKNLETMNNDIPKPHKNLIHNSPSDLEVVIPSSTVEDFDKNKQENSHETAVSSNGNSRRQENGISWENHDSTADEAILENEETLPTVPSIIQKFTEVPSSKDDITESSSFVHKDDNIKEINNRDEFGIDKARKNNAGLITPSLECARSLVNSNLLPIAFKQMCNQRTPLTSIKVQLNTSPNVRVSLLNQEQEAKENDHLTNCHHPLRATYSLMPPFPAAIYIKTPVKNSSLIKNIFTSEHQPVEGIKEISNIVPAPPTNSVNETLESEATLPQEKEDNKIEKVTGNAVLIKRSGVRTRGGFIKRGEKTERRVKAYLPSRTILQEDETDRKAQSCIDTNSEVNNKSVITSDVENKKVDSSNLDLNLVVSKEKLPEIVTKEEQTPRNLRKRISLSVPRRGSHIRALDFKTPAKNSIYNRRAITSPKQVQVNRSPSLKNSLRSIRRGKLFKTPKKENKAWDADLRRFTSESADIPTSVGLRRKNNKPNNEATDHNKFAGISYTQSSSRPEMNSLSSEDIESKNVESNEDLAFQIQKEVLSVIGDDIALLNDNTNLMSEAKLEKIITKKSISTRSCSDKKITLPFTENPVDTLNIENNITEENCITKDLQLSQQIKEKESLSEIPPSSQLLMTPVSKIIQEHKEILDKGIVTPGTPQDRENLSITIPSKDNHFTKGEVLNVVSPVVSTSCHDSLEASLIKECSRIEKENMKKRIEDLQLDEYQSKSAGEFEQDLHFENNIRAGDSGMLSGDPDLSSCTKFVDVNNIRLETAVIGSSGSYAKENTNSIENDHLYLPQNPERLLTPSASVNEKNVDSKSEMKNKSENSLMNNKSNTSRTLKHYGDNFVTDDKLFENLGKDNELKVDKEVKNRKCSKSTVDCSKLIAKCLRSAKENLYGSEKKNQPGTGNTISKKELRSRTITSSPNKTYKLSMKTLNKNISLETKIRNIDYLFSTSNSSSEDSDSNNSQTEVKSKLPELEEIQNRNEFHSAKSCSSDDTPLEESINFSLGEAQSPKKINLLKKTTLSEEIFSAKKTAEHENIKMKNTFTECSNTVTQLSSEKKLLGRSSEVHREADTGKIRRSSKEKESFPNENNLIHSKQEEMVTSKSYFKKIDKRHLKSECKSDHKNGFSNERTKYSEELSNYIYSFTLALDDTDKILTKQLKVSPFYDIFELASKDECYEKKERKIEKSIQNESKIRLELDERGRKRKSDKKCDSVRKSEMINESGLKNSFNDETKVNPNKKYKRDDDFTYEEPYFTKNERRRIYRDRYDESKFKRNFRTVQRSHVREFDSGRRYRDSYNSPRFRRYQPTNWQYNTPLRRKENTKQRDSYHSVATSPDSSHRYHKERSDKKNQEEHKKSDLNSRLQYKNSKRLKMELDQRIRFDKEDGELSESSLSANSPVMTPSVVCSSSNNQRTNVFITTPVDEKTRAKLKKVNLDHFLSLLHGSEK